jgi:hypothetical protein
MDKIQNRINKDDAKYAKICDLSERYDKLLTRESLLIVWQPMLKSGLPNTKRPVRKKPYQDHTFGLSIPLQLDDDSLDSCKLEHLS